jgi:hypothetical protein
MPSTSRWFADRKKDANSRFECKIAQRDDATERFGFATSSDELLLEVVWDTPVIRAA